MIYGYKVFNSEQDFINWQVLCKPNICQVSPIMIALYTEATGESYRNSNAAATAGLCVLYEKMDEFEEPK